MTSVMLIEYIWLLYFCLHMYKQKIFRAQTHLTQYHTEFSRFTAYDLQQSGTAAAAAGTYLSLTGAALWASRTRGSLSSILASLSACLPGLQTHCLLHVVHLPCRFRPDLERVSCKTNLAHYLLPTLSSCGLQDSPFPSVDQEIRVNEIVRRFHPAARAPARIIPPGAKKKELQKIILRNC